MMAALLLLAWLCIAMARHQFYGPAHVDSPIPTESAAKNTKAPSGAEGATKPDTVKALLEPKPPISWKDVGTEGTGAKADTLPKP